MSCITEDNQLLANEMSNGPGIVLFGLTSRLPPRGCAAPRAVLRLAICSICDFVYHT